MTFIPPWLKRLNPMTPLLAAVNTAELYDSVETVTVANEADLVFGSIAAAVDVTIDLEFTAVDHEDFIMGAELIYAGDAGAFTILGDSNGTYGAAIALVDGGIFLAPIPPDTYGTPYSVTIRALAANDGVAKAGTIAICDRFDFEGDAGAATRTLKTLTLSKTYDAP